MAREILSIPEENLADVVLVIRRGLNRIYGLISNETLEQLTKWCEETEEYLKE
jgi:hypothetical protein